MKKLLYTLLVLLIASFVLAACSGGAGDTDPTAVPEAETEVEAQPTDAPDEPAPSGDRVQIRWFVGLGTGTDPAQIEVQEEVAQDFNDSQDEIELVLEVVPFESSRDTLATQIASGNGPDIIGPVGWGGSNAFFGQWLDLSPYKPPPS
jgi:multiple sugar transport system substrate-binding protein